MIKKKGINFKARNKPIKKDTKSKNVPRKKIRGHLWGVFNTYFLKKKKDFEQKVKNNKTNNNNEDNIDNDLQLTPKIEFNKDGFVNISKIFALTKKKRFHAWFKTKQTKEYLNLLAKDLNITPETLFCKINKGRNHNNVYAHPEVAIYILKYISPQYRIKLNRWLADDKVSMDLTFAAYRRFYHLFVIHKIIYFRNASDLKDFENSFNRACEKYKIALGHEQFTNVTLEQLLDKLHHLIEFENFEGKIHFETSEIIKKYNDYVQQ